MKTRSFRTAHAITALAFLLLVMVGVPAVLAVIGAVPHHLPTLHALSRSLTTPDHTGQYFRVGGAIIAWGAWAGFTLATLRETVTAIRSRGMRPSMPTAGVSRFGPAALVATIALLFVTAPVVSLFTVPQAFAAAGPPGSLVSTAPSGSTIPDRTEVQAASTAPVLPTYQVKRYDTLWSIAQRHLPGDPAQRYRDIRNLNPTAVGTDNEIVAGATLTLPADAYGVSASARSAAASPTKSETVEIRPGQTLTEIAETHDLTDWHQVWVTNRGRLEPGGQRLINPDHIEPGWTLTLPRAGTAAGAPPTETLSKTPGRSAASSREAIRAARLPHTPPSTGSEPATVAPPTVQPAAAAATHPHAGGERVRNNPAADGQGWEQVFAGGGALLAAGMFTTLRTYRRLQARHRRPGRVIRFLPPELVPVEKALVTRGVAGVADVEFLDYALRSLSVVTAKSSGQLPNIVAVWKDAGRVELRLRQPHPTVPPAPWQVDESGCGWSVTVDDDLGVTLADVRECLAPYPTLVTVGHDPEGGMWLLDLEAAGAITISGDPHRCADLARFIAAELAVNAWCDQLTVTMVGFGPDIIALNPQRLRYGDNLDVAVKELSRQRDSAMETSDQLSVDVLTGRMRGVAGDTWSPHVLLVAPELTDTDALHALLGGIDEWTERATIALVRGGHADDTSGLQLHVAADGSLSISGLRMMGVGTGLTAEQLPADQVTALSDLIRKVDQTDDVPMPASTGTEALDAFIDASGALLPDVTSPRDIDGTADSVLPQPDREYLVDGAVAQRDLQVLAPRVAKPVSAAVIAADPALDADLADWRDSQSVTPKLILLGPVQLTAHGEKPAKRISYYTELAAFLATRENGATAEQIAAAFDVATTSIYTRINSVRSWLGLNPATGEPYLPASTRSGSGRARGVGVYEISGMATDADMFTRLRARGQALGGSAGIDYLDAALSLVTGRPFDQLRPGGYGWLAETPLDHYLTSGIVDAAHVVHLHHLQTGDLPGARAAAELGQLVAPYEDIPRLDLVAVMKAEGLDEEADRYLRDEVCNRSDDGEAPIDLPERTAGILRQRQWPTRAV